MFPSFTGSARPKRQVNLSGRNSNPFATQGSRAPQAPQTAQNALAQAQQERLSRQQERERPPAATKIQKAWRGYRVRNDLARERRRRWDTQEQRDQASGSGSHYIEEGECLSQLNLLNSFSTSHGQDVSRLHSFAQKYMATIRIQHFQGLQWTYPRLTLAKKVISNLNVKMEEALPFDVSFDLLILLESLATDIAPVLVRERFLYIICRLLSLLDSGVGWGAWRSSSSGYPFCPARQQRD